MSVSVNIIGTGPPTEMRLNPASISVVEGEELRRSPPASIAQLLRDVPGVQVNEERIERGPRNLGPRRRGYVHLIGKAPAGRGR